MALHVAIAVTRPNTNAKTLKLARPLVRSITLFEVGVVGLLTLAGAGLWVLVIPLELVGFFAG